MILGSLKNSDNERTQEASVKEPRVKTLYTLSINDYAPAIKELTFPLLKHHAEKIGARFQVISERRWPHMPVTFEKFQVAEMALASRDDWSLFFDADTLINPEQFDITEHLPMDTVAHNGRDVAGIRWRYDRYMRRDGRNVGSCTWCVIASDWTVADLWDRPFWCSWDDVDQVNHQLETTVFSNIHPTIGEHNSGHCEREHLIDDYLLSRNIARFGLKFTTVVDICAGLGFRQPNGNGVSPYLWHQYTISEDQKLRSMLAVLSTPQHTPAFAEAGEILNTPNGPVVKTPDGRILQPCGLGWGLMSQSEAQDFRKKWGVK